jgi:hypothetical protein
MNENRHKMFFYKQGCLLICGTLNGPLAGLDPCPWISRSFCALVKPPGVLVIQSRYKKY